MSGSNQTAPPDEKFWQSYSKHGEFPLSTVGSIAVHVLVFGFLALLLHFEMNSKDNASVPIRIVSISDTVGQDERFGDPTGPEKIENPAERPLDPEKANAPTLSTPKTVVPKWTPNLDPEAPNSFAFEEQARRSNDLKNQMAKGVERTFAKGKDPGPTGTITAKRLNRWTLRFNTKNGRDYLAQLDSVGAILLIPQPPDWKSSKIIRDLKTPNAGKEEDLTQFAQMQFTDTRPDSVRDVAQALGLDFTPQYFTAFFPREFEEDLARKEKAYRDRKEDDIAQTIFQVVVRNGKPEITVVEQRLLPGRK